MSIRFDEKNQTITLHTAHTTYQMQIDAHGFLRHTYYGAKVMDADMTYLHKHYDRACAGNPKETYPSRAISFNIIPQEFTGYGVGDYRINSIALQNADGSYAADFRYVRHEIMKGKYKIPGLPAAYDNGGEAESLVVTIEDALTKLEVKLYYGVFEEKDVITRCAVITNHAEDALKLQKAASMCIDFPYGKWDLIHFHGKHALERQLERNAVTHSVQTVGSNRGTSSHQQNPFVILCDRKAQEEHGACYGFMLVYSGGFKAEVEMDQLGSTRVVMGIQDDQFEWKLNANEAFYTPEVIMSYADDGFERLSHNYHELIRHNICRGKYKLARRPVLINNWEGTYFDFDDEKLLNIAEEAKTLGVEMLVLDDGWFGIRNEDISGLGDWFVNEDKVKCGMKALVDQVNEKGLKFGLWFEPEMVNEDSELYRAHPEWALAVPGRQPIRARSQLVLDMGREDVREYLYGCISKLLRETNIEYIKWDMNRSLSDVYSNALPVNQQGEVLHRYVLGVYDLMERLTSDFPHVLFEGCSGGGARFDAGILYYSPQIWTSDDTDPIHRLNIQYGTSFGYPVSTMGAHVSASPNHQTGRPTPLHTRGVVAMSGTFGYELDPCKLSEEEKEEIRVQVETFKRHYNLIQGGTYFRLTEIKEDWYESWMFVSEQKDEALVNIVVTDIQPNQPLIHLALRGLDANGVYELDEINADCENIEGFLGDHAGNAQMKHCKYTGAALMNGGITLPYLKSDYPAIQLHFKKI